MTCAQTPISSMNLTLARGSYDASWMTFHPSKVVKSFSYQGIFSPSRVTKLEPPAENISLPLKNQWSRPSEPVLTCGTLSRYLAGACEVHRS